MFPQAVLRELEQVAAAVMEEEASRDAMSRKVHDAYVRFRDDIRKYELLRGDKLGI